MTLSILMVIDTINFRDDAFFSFNFSGKIISFLFFKIKRIVVVVCLTF